ncbi:permease-like cell division protein FtsX [Nonomuraea sp. NPDC050556]|uniref:permease-like cell division protein FtsX n=1 Tax=Nonomuraea sp. NPDC050556 TaxID=3364369 RepID=UPI003787E5E2
MRANFILSEVWIGLRRNLTMTIAVVMTVAVGMAMLGVGLLVGKQVNLMKDFWYDKVEVSVFLCNKAAPMPACNGKGISNEQTSTLQAALKKMPGVENVIYEDQAQAYKNYLETADKTMASVAKAEDMPTSFRIKLADPNGSAALVQQIVGQPGVAAVKDHKDLLSQFFKLLDKISLASMILAGALVVAAILLIGNTVRLSAFNRRRETGIMRLVGASNLYIQLPFVMEGVIAGMIGGVLAAITLIVAKVFLFDGVQAYINAGTPLGWDAVAQTIVYIMIIGVVICVLASFVTLRRYLRV